MKHLIAPPQRSLAVLLAAFCALEPSLFAASFRAPSALRAAPRGTVLPGAGRAPRLNSTVALSPASPSLALSPIAPLAPASQSIRAAATAQAASAAAGAVPAAAGAPAAAALAGVRKALEAMPAATRLSASQDRASGVRLEQAMTLERSSGDGEAEPVPAGQPPLSAEAVAQVGELVRRIKAEVGKVVIGQHQMIDLLLLALIANEHPLLEGPPGVAKTLVVEAMAAAVGAKYSRIQGVPDLLPSDISGAQILQTDPATGERRFVVDKGPIFAEVVLADEINRMVPKTQSALLQPMQEREVTIAKQTFPLPEAFMVAATQNPVEQEGTNRLPEAQLDRFFFKILVDLPTIDEQREIDRVYRLDKKPKASAVATPADLKTARLRAEKVRLAPELEEYKLRLIDATRNPQKYGLDAKVKIALAASARPSIAIDKAARIRAIMEGRDYVTLDDVKYVARPILRHRLQMAPEAMDIPVEKVVDMILSRVPGPGDKGASAWTAPVPGKRR